MRTARILLLALVAAALAPASARAGDEALCARAVTAAARKQAVSRELLTALSLVESGRAVGGRVAAWPWTINVAGTGQVFASKAEAVAAAAALLAAGQSSIDVGCLQINLAFHPQAFASLDDAFDPERNADYAARFLRALEARLGSLAASITSYHSQTPDRAADYARRVLAVWPGAAKLGLIDPQAAPAPPSDRLPRLAVLMTPTRRPDAAQSRISYRSDRGAGWPQKPS